MLSSTPWTQAWPCLVSCLCPCRLGGPPWCAAAAEQEAALLWRGPRGGARKGSVGRGGGNAGPAQPRQGGRPPQVRARGLRAAGDLAKSTAPKQIVRSVCALTASKDLVVWSQKCAPSGKRDHRSYPVMLTVQSIALLLSGPLLRARCRLPSLLPSPGSDSSAASCLSSCPPLLVCPPAPAPPPTPLRWWATCACPARRCA